MYRRMKAPLLYNTGISGLRQSASWPMAHDGARREVARVVA